MAEQIIWTGLSVEEQRKYRTKYLFKQISYRQKLLTR